MFCPSRTSIRFSTFLKHLWTRQVTCLQYLQFKYCRPFGDSSGVSLVTMRICLERAGSYFLISTSSLSFQEFYKRIKSFCFILLYFVVLFLLILYSFCDKNFYSFFFSFSSYYSKILEQIRGIKILARVSLRTFNPPQTPQW